jgi:hypothetical protein
MLLQAALVLLAMGVTVGLAACDDGGRQPTPLERGAVREIVVEHKHVPGGGLDARVRKGDLLDLRVFVIGAGARPVESSICEATASRLASNGNRQLPGSGRASGSTRRGLDALA